jgi:hypothetical protein
MPQNPRTISAPMSSSRSLTPNAAASAPSTTHSNSTVVAFELQQASNVPLSTAEIKKKPWKYLGYKTFASWMSSGHDFFVIRRFDSLNARIILMVQWEVSELEKELKELDDQFSAREYPARDNGTFQRDDPKRKRLLQKIYQKLRQYSEPFHWAGVAIFTK